MNWTRMRDGSYLAVKVSYGVTRCYEVRRLGRPADRSSLWALYCNGEFVANDRGPDGCTFRGAKDRAGAHFCASVRAVEAAR